MSRTSDKNGCKSAWRLSMQKKRTPYGAKARRNFRLFSNARPKPREAR